MVLTRKIDHSIEGCELFDSPEAVLADVGDDQESMIVGGAQLYQAFLPMANRLYLTLIDANLEGDTFFPEYKTYQWKESFREQHEADEINAYAYTFVILDKIG